VTVTGSITAEGGVLAGSGTIVEVNGDIEADRGIYVSGIEISVTVVGDIKADYVGVLVAWWDGPSRNVEVTVTGSITAAKDNPGTYWLGTGVLAFGCVGLTITVNGNMDVEYCGVIVEECEEALVIVNGNIKAGYIGVFALDDVQVFANGDIQVTSEELPFEDVLLVGVASGFGAEVTVEGTITAKNYIALYFDKYWADNPYGEGSGWVYTFVYVEANGNIATSSKTGYLEYNDSDGDLQSISYVWVKAATTPGTGDSTAPWLLIAALMVAALGTASVLAYRKREEKE